MNNRPNLYFTTLRFLGGRSPSAPLLAQTPEDPSVDDPAVPVDGGLSLLLAAGAAYGVRRQSKREDGTKP